MVTLSTTEKNGAILASRNKPENVDFLDFSPLVCCTTGVPKQKLKLLQLLSHHEAATGLMSKFRAGCGGAKYLPPCPN